MPDAQLTNLAKLFVGKILWGCDEAPFPTYMVHEITASGPANKPVDQINATCVEVVRCDKPYPCDFEVPSRCILGSGAEATYKPEKLFDLVLVKLNEGSGKEVKPYMGEYIEAHRQREDALGMAAEDIHNTGTGAATPATKTKGKKRKQNSK